MFNHLLVCPPIILFVSPLFCPSVHPHVCNHIVKIAKSIAKSSEINLMNFMVLLNKNRKHSSGWMFFKPFVSHDLWTGPDIYLHMAVAVVPVKYLPAAEHSAPKGTDRSGGHTPQGTHRVNQHPLQLKLHSQHFLDRPGNTCGRIEIIR